MSVRDCAHATCSCRVEVDEEFCAPSCKAAAGSTLPRHSDGCDCGHQGCLGNAGKRHEEKRGMELEHPQNPPPGRHEP